MFAEVFASHVILYFKIQYHMRLSVKVLLRGAWAEQRPGSNPVAEVFASHVILYFKIQYHMRLSVKVGVIAACGVRGTSCDTVSQNTVSHEVVGEGRSDCRGWR